MQFRKLCCKLLFAFLFFLSWLNSGAQYYLKGTTTDSAGKPLPFVKIRLLHSGIIYESGSAGDFGIPSGIKQDSATCTLHGYDTLRLVLKSGLLNAARLTQSKIYREDPIQSNTLSSLTKNLPADAAYRGQLWDESYTEVVENAFINTRDFPTTGFAPNGNNAGYSNVRRFLNNELAVPQDAVRMEELLNYFSLSTAPAPLQGQLFSTDIRVTDCPWKQSSKLLFLNAQAKTLELDKVPPANLVFLIDNSGSMDMPNRLPLLKSAFIMLAKNLRDTDFVSIVTYGGSAGIILPPTSGRDKDRITNVIKGIMPGGATPGSNGIQLAYELAINTKIVHGNNRVILATDGDFNVGITEEKELIALIERYKYSGIFLTCLGVGMGNYKDSKIEMLAKHGNGNFAYLDKQTEAEKVLVKELTQNLYAVAGDVTMHVDFNPLYIARYRLIGYDNRTEAIKDSTSKLIGSELGSGYSMVSIFEIEPTDTSAKGLKALEGKNIGNLRIDAIDIKAGRKAIIPIQPINYNYAPFNAADGRMRFATALCMFGSILRKSPYITGINFNQVLSIAQSGVSSDDALQMEFLQLIEQARDIYSTDKKKKARN